LRIGRSTVCLRDRFRIGADCRYSRLTPCCAAAGSLSISTYQVVIVLLGALAGGFVNGLTGFGTGITAMGIWLYAISPTVAATLVIISSVVSQLQTLPMIWHAIEFRRVLWFIVPGLIGVPVGTLLLAHVDAQVFKLGIGLFLVAYSTYALIWRARKNAVGGGAAADAAVGFTGGVLGGVAGFSGPPVIVWTDLKNYTKDHRRSVLQSYNLSILAAALLAHAGSGLLTRDVGLAVLAAVPGTVCGALCGAGCYKRLGDRGFREIIMMLLLVSGAALLWTSR
jgi:uncharacterized protein